MRTSIPVAPVVGLVLALMLGLGLTVTACGSTDTPPPAVCSSVDDLKASVADLKNVDLTSSGGLTDLKDALATVRKDLKSVETDAKSEFSDEAKSVDTSFNALQAALEQVANTPSVAALGTVKSALTDFAAGVKSFVADVQATC